MMPIPMSIPYKKYRILRFLFAKTTWYNGFARRHSYSIQTLSSQRDCRNYTLYPANTIPFYPLINNYFLLILLIFFSSFLSVFPDIDTWKSKIRGLFSFILASIAIVYFFFNMSFNSISSIIISFILIYVLFRFFPIKHRGITHNFSFSVFISFMLTIILWLLFNFSMISFLVYFTVILSGYLSHLFLDAF